MLNLLFISDSPKIEYIKKVLQPVLKVIIDVVPDFDHGLKDVFEKRPATVCIQDQIAGVTGESVARHIQMLLGTGAPQFILIHEGSGKAKQIKGLFEYIVDISQPEAKLAEEIQGTLKALIGDQWDKIFISPKQPVSASPAAALSVESRKEADKLIDDFLSDLETSGFSAVADETPVPLLESEPVQPEPSIMQTTADELAEMLLEQADHVRQTEIAAEKQLSAAAGRGRKSEEALKPKSSAETTSSPVTSGISSKPARARSISPKQKQAAAPEAGKVAELPGSAGDVTETARMVSATVSHAPPVAPEEFRINHGKPLADEQIPDDLLLAFEENYRSESNARRRIITVAVVALLFVALGGWYLVKQKPDLLASFGKVPTPAVKPVTQPVSPVSPAAPGTQPVPAGQKPAQILSEKPSMPPFPTFIPREGHDKSFAATKPGWERYIGEQVEFRVFGAGGKPKALQILAAKGKAVPDSLIKTVLTELAGNADYQISSRENKAGFLLLRGSVAKKADVLFYKKGSTVRAFVVSLY